MDRIGFNLFAEAGDERTGVGRRCTWSPDGHRYGAVRDELTGPARQECEEVELVVAECHLNAAPEDRAAVEIKLQASRQQSAAVRARTSLAECRAKPRQKILWAKRLSKEVAGTAVESRNRALLLARRRENDEGHIRNRSEPGAQLHAVDVRQVEVENDEIG